MPGRRTLTTYLEMFAPPQDRVAPPRPGLAVRRRVRPTLEFYRRLYVHIGARFGWVDRLRMPDDELRAILNDDRVEMWVLYRDGEPIGYGELDRRITDEIELAYFGLVPEAIGCGLGKYLLNWVLHRAWSYRPRRVWLHTCDLDHPAAIPNYLKAGFKPCGEKYVEQWLPDDSPLLTPNRATGLAKNEPT